MVVLFSFDLFMATVNAVDATKTVALIKRLGGLKGALSAFTKTGNKGHGNIGAYAHVYAGILETLQYGQKNKLKGFAIASKKTSHVFKALVNEGVLDDSGKVLIGVHANIGNITETMADATNFVAWCISVDAMGKESAKLESEAKKDETEASEAETIKAETEASEAETLKAETLTPGQMADAATTLIIQAFQAGTLSTDNLTALYAALAPHGIKTAPKAKKEPLPALV